MKKFITIYKIALIGLLAAGILSGCGEKKDAKELMEEAASKMEAVTSLSLIHIQMCIRDSYTAYLLSDYTDELGAKQVVKTNDGNPITVKVMQDLFDNIVNGAGNE